MSGQITSDKVMPRFYIAKLIDFIVRDLLIIINSLKDMFLEVSDSQLN